MNFYWHFTSHAAAAEQRTSHLQHMNQILYRSGERTQQSYWEDGQTVRAAGGEGGEGGQFPLVSLRSQMVPFA